LRKDNYLRRYNDIFRVLPAAPLMWLTCWRRRTKSSFAHRRPA